MKNLKLAIDLACQSKDEKSFYFCCAAKRSDGPLVFSVNHNVSSQKIPQHHAEARVLRKCNYGSVLYVARVLKDRKTLAIAKPCIFCQNFIKNKGVKKVYFTIDNRRYGLWKINNNLWTEYELRHNFRVI